MVKSPVPMARSIANGFAIAFGSLPDLVAQAHREAARIRGPLDLERGHVDSGIVRRTAAGPARLTDTVRAVWSNVNHSGSPVAIQSVPS